MKVIPLPEKLEHILVVEVQGPYHDTANRQFKDNVKEETVSNFFIEKYPNCLVEYARIPLDDIQLCETDIDLKKTINYYSKRK